MKEDFKISDGVLYVKEGVTQLEDQQFAERGDFKKLVLPESLRIMGTEVFSCCGELEEVVMPDSLKYISIAAFAYCPRLKELKLPSALKSVGEGAFLECESYAYFTLPEGLEEICDMAFWGTGVQSVRIPASVRRVGESAFWSCESLRRADVLGKDTRICPDAFGSCYDLAEGYIAPGFAEDNSPPAELLYTILWCSCPERHGEKTAARARRFIEKKEGLVMERIFRQGNTAALTTLSKQRLLKTENIDLYIRKANEEGRTQMTALLLNAKGEDRYDEGEFEL